MEESLLNIRRSTYAFVLALDLYFFQRECIQMNIAAGQRPERWVIGKVILGYNGLVLSIQSELSIVLCHTDNCASLLNCLCFLKH